MLKLIFPIFSIPTNHYHPQDDVSIKILGKYSQTESLAKVYQFFFADLNWKSFPNI